MSNPWREYGRYGSVGIELVISVMLGWFAGGWVDHRFFGGHDVGAIIGLFLGAVAGFRQILRAATFMQKDVKRAEQQRRGENPWESEVPLPEDSELHVPKDETKPGRPQ